MIDSGLLSECRELAFVIAPELKKSPLYVVDGSIFDGLPTPPGDCLGWAHDGSYVDYNIRGRLGESWTTPGPIISLNRHAIQGEYGEQFRDGVLAIFLHELGHVLPPSPHIPKDDRAALFDCQPIRQHQYAKAAEAVALPAPPAGSPDDSHDVRFLRRVCHLYFRAVSCGWTIPMDTNLFGGSCWFCSWPIHYLFKLLPEVIQHRQATFLEIESVPAPAGFIHLWENNLAFYQSFQTPKESP